MKKVLSALLSLALAAVCIGMCFSAVSADGGNVVIEMKVGDPIMSVNGEKVGINAEGTAPVIVNDRTLVPIRAIIEAMGGRVEWNNEARSVTLLYGDDEIRLVIGSSAAYLNNEQQTLDVAPAIINDRTMLPIRFISESFGFDVGWDGGTETISIKKSSDSSDERILIAYFTLPELDGVDEVSGASRVVDNGDVKGAMQYMAQIVEDETGGDLFQIKTVQTYPTPHSALIEQAQDEQKNNVKPELAAHIIDLDAYDTIFVGYPIWWSDLPSVMYSFFDEYDFSGKKLVLFSSHGGSRLAGTPEIIAELEPDALIEESVFTVERDDVPDSEGRIREWLHSIGYGKSGEEYSIGTNAFDLEKGTVRLNNGNEMPIFGIGTFALSPEQAENSVYWALSNGYKLIDTANAYNNEEGVGRGIKRAIDEGKVKRDDFFLTAKLWFNNYSEEGIDATLERLGVDYVDLMLLHQPFGDSVTGWQELEKAYAAGKVRAIGLSNFESEENWNKIMEVAAVPPAVDQVETHPYYQQTWLMDYMDKYGTVIEAWYPLGGRGNTQVLFSDPAIVEIAEAHGKSPAQIILRWHLQAGHIAIPGSSNEEHIKENIDIFDFELSDEEMAKMKALDKNDRFFKMGGMSADELENVIREAGE